MKYRNLSKIVIEKSVDYEKNLGRKILILKDKKIYTLNQEGKIIWKFIDKIPVEKICEEIAKSKKLSLKKVRKDVMNFIDELSKFGLIKIKKR